MRALTTLTEALVGELGFLHAKTLQALWRGVAGVLNADQLWLTAVGRGLPGECADKHRIKATDRLLGNAQLHQQLGNVYAVVAAFLVEKVRRPCILVDWTGVGPKHHMLSASLCFFGRSLPILSLVYPDKMKASPVAERDFLNALAQVIPRNVKPILITDAGFNLVWYERVQQLGWDFVGRLRGRVYVLVEDAWLSLAELHRSAGRKPLDLGVVPVSRRREQRLRTIVSRRKRKGRKRLTRKGSPRRDATSKKATRAARDPWVLITSLQDRPKHVVARYALRMQVEECFRDLKAHRHGWSLDFVRSRCAKRIQVLLLLAALAVIAAHTIGLAAEKANAHRKYQANTIRERRVLSTFFLGRLLIKDGAALRLPHAACAAALANLRAFLHEASEFA